MAVKIGIMGFGRIGRNVLRAAKKAKKPAKKAKKPKKVPTGWSLKQGCVGTLVLATS